MKILLINDDIAHSQKLQKLIAKIGECTVIANETTAFQLFQDALNQGIPYDLVLKNIFFKPADSFKILIVDDDLVSRAKIQKLMNKIGEGQAVESGLEAVRVFQQALEQGKPFELVLLDIAMPEMDGIETLRQIRELESEKGLSKEKRSKIIMVTAFSDRKNIVKCMRAGCDDYLKKPFKREMIVKKLLKHGVIRIK